jgi:succinylglutamate desuccinylase
MKVFSDRDVQGVIRVDSGAPGPRVVMFSGVHGDEVSGIHAIEKAVFDFLGGTRTLSRGSLALVRANQQAIETERRYVRLNMNRLFRDEYGPETDRDAYEFRRTQELKPLLESCDYFLDFHSAPIADTPFLVAEEAAVAFYRQLGISRIMTGWSKFSAGAIGGDAENYANAHGALSATLESGSHFDKSSNDVAYASAMAMLSVLSMIEGYRLPDSPGTEIVDMYSVVIKDFEDFRYEGEANNFKFFKRGDAFASQNGSYLTVAEDSYLLIPMRPEDTRLGEEVCYLGRRVQAPGSAPAP